MTAKIEESKYHIACTKVRKTSAAEGETLRARVFVKMGGRSMMRVDFTHQ